MLAKVKPTSLHLRALSIMCVASSEWMKLGGNACSCLRLLTGSQTCGSCRVTFCRLVVTLRELLERYGWTTGMRRGVVHVTLDLKRGFARLMCFESSFTNPLGVNAVLCPAAALSSLAWVSFLIFRVFNSFAFAFFLASACESTSDVNCAICSGLKQVEMRSAHVPNQT